MGWVRDAECGGGVGPAPRRGLHPARPWAVTWWWGGGSSGSTFCVSLPRGGPQCSPGFGLIWLCQGRERQGRDTSPIYKRGGDGGSAAPTLASPARGGAAVWLQPFGPCTVLGSLGGCRGENRGPALKALTTQAVRGNHCKE